MNHQQLLRYSRHILLDEIDIDGQERLLKSRIMVVGCGGLGSAALPYLAAAGVGTLIIADDDWVDESNLQRQISYGEQQIGQAKVEAMAQFLQSLNAHCEIIRLHQRVDRETLLELLPTCQVVLDCSDNYRTRQAINYASVHTKTPLVSGAAIRFEGQLSVYRPDLTHQQPACYHCLFDGDQANDGGCATSGVFSPLVGIIGTLQAAEALKISLGFATPFNQLRCYHALTGEWRTFEFERDEECAVCSQRAVNPSSES